MKIKRVRGRDKLIIGKTDLFSYTILVILILQNGIFKNLPIVLLCLPIFLSKYRINIKVGKCEGLLLIYGSYLIFITFWNWKTNFNTQYSINLFIQYLLIYTCLKIEVRGINLQYMIQILKKFGLINSVLCIIEAIAGKNIWADILGKAGEIPDARVVGIFNHPIVCGCFLLITFIMIIIFPNKNKLKQVVSILLIIGAIILTQSRSAWIAVMVVLALYILKFHSNKLNVGYAKYIIIVILSGIVVSFGMGNNILNSILNFINARIGGSLQAGQGHIVRIEIILNSLKYWKSNTMALLFGNGKNAGLTFMKNNPVIKFNTFKWDSAIDNQYMSLIHETGLIGVIIIICILSVSLKRFFKSQREDKIQIMVSLAIIGNAVCLFFFDGFQYPILVLFYIMFIMMSDIDIDNKRENIKMVRKNKIVEK